MVRLLSFPSVCSRSLAKSDDAQHLLGYIFTLVQQQGAPLTGSESPAKWCANRAFDRPLHACRVHILLRRARAWVARRIALVTLLFSLSLPVTSRLSPCNSSHLVRTCFARL